MTARAYVLIETAVGRTKEVASTIKRLEGVQSVDPVTGPYDIGDIVTSKIHPIAGISRTVTCLAIWSA